jgi:hypothetical protein
MSEVNGIELKGEEWLSQYKPVPDTRIEDMREWLNKMATTKAPGYITAQQKFNIIFPIQK